MGVERVLVIFQDKPLSRLINGKLSSRSFKFMAIYLNPLTPSDAVWKQKKNILEVLFSLVLSQFKKISPPPPRNLKFNYLGISQSLKLRILMEKILSMGYLPIFF